MQEEEKKETSEQLPQSETHTEEPKKKFRFTPEIKMKIIKFSVVICVVAIFTVGCYFIFDALGFLNQDELSATIGSLGAVWVYVIFMALFILQAVCLCVIPGNTTSFIVLGGVVFQGNFWVVFLVCVIAIWLASCLLFLVGRFGGRKVLYWLFSKKDVDKKLDIVTQKGSYAMPALFLIPFMPNDMLCVICGASKLKFWNFLMIVIPFRAIEVLMILCYPLLGELFVADRPIQDVIIFFNILIIDIFLIFMYYKTLIKLFRKNILRKQYVVVEKPYTIEEEVPTQKRKR